MAYLGKVKRQRNFKVAPYVIQLDPKGFLGIRLVGCRSGLTWYKLEDLCQRQTKDVPGQTINTILARVDSVPGAVEV